jgi:ketosteroid isomerase-like protein
VRGILGAVSREIVQRIYDGGLMDHAVDDMRPLRAPDVEYVNPPDAIEPGTRRGIDDVMVAFGAVGAFETATSELQQLFAAGDSVVAAVTFRARSRGSDVELAHEEAHTWTFRDGKVIRFDWCRDLAAALEAAGVQKNVEIVRSLYTVLAEQGVEAVLPYVDPEYESTTPSSLASEPDTYRGHDGVRRWFGSFDDAMEGVHLEAVEFTSVGDRVLVETKLHARGRSTGIETEQRAFLVWTFRDGLVTSVEAFPDREDALKAAERQE